MPAPSRLDLPAVACTIRMATADRFKGNKSSLPSKPCAVCGRPMTWRKRWAKTWDDVRYCSDACRQRRGTAVSNRHG